MAGKISITISPIGIPTIEAKDFEGASCEAATAPIEKALGGSGVKDYKPEYYDVNGNKVQQHISW